MAINKITKLDLESRAIELRGKEKSFAEIAITLSEESKEVITQSSVQRFFATREQAKVQAVEKSDKLKARVAEAEINTLEEAMECVEKLKEICQALIDAGDLRGAILAAREIYTGLDLVNKTLGKYQAVPQNFINNSAVQVNLRMIDCSKRGD